jgi:hypothetical protein
MKAGTENRNKTIMLGVLGTCALLGVGYTLYNQFGDSSPTPPATIMPVGKTINSTNAALNEPANANTSVAKDAASRPAAMPTGNAAGVGAKKMASASASLDPTLDQSAMLRTEHLVYSGTGRNIFSAIYVPVGATKMPIPVGNGRKVLTPPTPPPLPIPPPTCPPSCPPINLKFFGTATRANGLRQAFLLQGDDVFLASPGDIVARRYKIVSIAANSIQIEDLGNNNTQTLPLQSN